MSSGRRVSDAQLQCNISSSAKSTHMALVNLTFLCEIRIHRPHPCLRRATAPHLTRLSCRRGFRMGSCLVPVSPEVFLSASGQPSIMISIVAVPTLLLSDQLLDIC